jgi:hypothetical protein
MSTVSPVTGADGAVGCDFLLSKNQLIFVETDGEIDAVNLSVNPPNKNHVFLGKGYKHLVDIKIASDGKHAYVTEQEGNLLRVDLANPNVGGATVVAHGMTAPQQIVLDEAHGVAYVVEFAPNGRILRINLALHSFTTVATGVKNGNGLLLTADGQFAYVTQQTGELLRIRLSTGNREVVAMLQRPFFLAWFGDSEATILATEHDPANKLVQIDLTHTPVTVTDLATFPKNPSGIAIVGSSTVYVASEMKISELALSGFSAGDPIFMGIGHVPVSRIGGNLGAPATIPQGMATTDPGYFFQVVDAPFGGTLALMFNHKTARDLHATTYRVAVDSVAQAVVPFADYRWNSGTSTFDLISNPTPVGPAYTVRAAGDVWYNPWLGAFIDTTPLTTSPSGIYRIGFQLFNSHGIEIGQVTDPGRFAFVLIDNGLPVASIDHILHNGVEVPVCAIEHIGVDKWTFDITAHDAEKHLSSWWLTAMWGDNKSALVGSGSYTPVASGLWEGLPPDPHIVPVPFWKATVAGDSSSTNCAHTFYLGVWDRVINGWGYIHYADYHKSITIIP